MRSSDRSASRDHGRPTVLPPSGPVLAAGAVPVHTDDDGLHAPPRVPAGRLTFRLSTDLPIAAVGLARLGRGHTFEGLRAGLTAVNDDERHEVRAGAARLHGMELLGGLLLRRGQCGTFEQDLSPGRYELFDYSDITTARVPRRATLDVEERPGPRERPAPLDTAALSLTAVEGPRPALIARGAAGTASRVRFENRLGSRPVDAVFLRVLPGAGDDEVRSWLCRFRAEDPPSHAPVDLGSTTGCMAVSARRGATVTLPLSPGRHAVACLVNDFEIGGRSSSRGLFTILTIREGRRP